MVGFADYSTATGWYHGEMLSITSPAVFAIVAVGAGVALASEEKRRTISVLLAAPVSRLKVAGSKLTALGLLVALCGVLLFAGIWLANLISSLGHRRGQHRRGAALQAALGLVFGTAAFAVAVLDGAVERGRVGRHRGGRDRLGRQHVRRRQRRPSGSSRDCHRSTGRCTRSRSTTAWTGRDSRSWLRRRPCWRLSDSRGTGAGTCAASAGKSAADGRYPGPRKRERAIDVQHQLVGARARRSRSPSREYQSASER